MFKKFSSKQSSRSGSGHKKEQSFSSVQDGVAERKAEIGAERELFAYERPTQEMGISDLIKSHEPGTRFMYAALTGKEEEDHDSRLRRLIGFKPRLNKQAFPIDKLPALKLFRETEIFPLKSILTHKNLGPYIRIADAICLYGAVVSPDCNFTHIKIGIMDGRLLERQMVKSFRATTNIQAIGNLRLAYCFPKADIDRISLAITRDRSFIEEGLQWGAVQIQLMIESYEFPMQFDNEDVVATNKMPRTLLQDRDRDPDFIDISVTNNARKGLAGIFLEGDMADEGDPVENRVAVAKYSRTTIGGQTGKGKKIEPAAKDWGFMSNHRGGMQPIDERSISVPDDSESEVPSRSFDIFPQSQHGGDRTPMAKHSSVEGDRTIPETASEVIDLKAKKVVGFGEPTVIKNDNSRVTPWG
jgi:hypothetical protein